MNIGQIVLQKKLDKVFGIIKKAGDDGITQYDLMIELGWTPNGLASALGQLLKAERITKHKTLPHYFVNHGWEDTVFPYGRDESEKPRQVTDLEIMMKKSEELHKQSMDILNAIFTRLDAMGK